MCMGGMCCNRARSDDGREAAGTIVSETISLPARLDSHSGSVSASSHSATVSGR